MALRTKVKEYRENVFHVSAEELFEFMEDRHLHIPMPGPRTSPTDKENARMIHTKTGENLCPCLCISIFNPSHKRSNTNSSANTAAHAAVDTWNRLFPRYAKNAATISAAAPDQIEEVAVSMAGKVITESVT